MESERSDGGPCLQQDSTDYDGWMGCDRSATQVVTACADSMGDLGSKQLQYNFQICTGARKRGRQQDNDGLPTGWVRSMSHHMVRHLIVATSCLVARGQESLTSVEPIRYHESSSAAAHGIEGHGTMQSSPVLFPSY